MDFGTGRDLWKNRAFLFLAVLLVTVAYLIVTGNNTMAGFTTEFITLDMDKPVDGFVQRLIMNGDMSGLSVFSCECNLQNIVILLLCRVAGCVEAGLNIYYLLSFAFIAASMYWFLQKLGMDHKLAVFGAVLAVLLPFHTDRGQGQMISSNFFMAPLFMGMFYDLFYLNGNLFPSCSNDGTVKHGRSFYMVLAAAAPFIDLRLSFMALILMAVLCLASGRECAKGAAKYALLLLASSMLAGGLTGFFSVPDTGAAMKFAEENGLRPLDFVVPIRYHVWGRLMDFRVEYDVAFNASGESGLNTPGYFAAAGFLISTLGIFLGKKEHSSAQQGKSHHALIRWTGFINLIIMIVSGVCGFNLIFEYMGIHVAYWDRMGIFMIVNAIAVAVIMFDKLCAFLKKYIGIKIRRADRAAEIFINVSAVITGLAAVGELLLRHWMFG